MDAGLLRIRPALACDQRHHLRRFSTTTLADLLGASCLQATAPPSAHVPAKAPSAAPSATSTPATALASPTTNPSTSCSLGTGLTSLTTLLQLNKIADPKTLQKDQILNVPLLVDDGVDAPPAILGRWPCISAQAELTPPLS